MRSVSCALLPRGDSEAGARAVACTGCRRRLTSRSVFSEKSSQIRHPGPVPSVEPDLGRRIRTCFQVGRQGRSHHDCPYNLWRQRNAGSSICPKAVVWVGGLVSCLCLIGPRSTHAGQYKFVTVDAPGAFATEIYGINDNGVISGLSLNSSFVSTGFLYNQGTYTSYTTPLPGGGRRLTPSFIRSTTPVR